MLLLLWLWLWLSLRPRRRVHRKALGRQRATAVRGRCHRAALQRHLWPQVAHHLGPLMHRNSDQQTTGTHPPTTLLVPPNTRDTFHSHGRATFGFFASPPPCKMSHHLRSLPPQKLTAVLPCCMSISIAAALPTPTCHGRALHSSPRSPSLLARCALLPSCLLTLHLHLHLPLPLRFASLPF